MIDQTPPQKPKIGKPKKGSLDAVAQNLGEIESRVENWEELAPTLTRRIEEEARLRASVKAVDPNFMKDTEAQMVPIDYALGMPPPMPSQELRELDEHDLFRPVPTASNMNTFASGREVQVATEGDFRWSPEFMDRIERDVTEYYIDGEINA